MMTFIIFRDKHKEYRWHLKAKNGRLIASSGESYKRKSQVTRMIGKIILGPHKIVG